MLEKLYENSELVFNAREVHKKLELKNHFRDWVYQKKNSFDLQEGEDYFVYERVINYENSNLRRLAKEYLFKYDTLLRICQGKHHSVKYSEILEYLYSLKEEMVIVKDIKRKGLEFTDILKKTLSALDLNILEEVVVTDRCYRIDYVISGYFVEYDEIRHKYIEEKDREREKYIIEYFEKLTLGDWAPQFIRIKQGEELEGISRLIKTLISQNTLCSWNEELCTHDYDVSEFTSERISLELLK